MRDKSTVHGKVCAIALFELDEGTGLYHAVFTLVIGKGRLGPTLSVYRDKEKIGLAERLSGEWPISAAGSKVVDSLGIVEGADEALRRWADDPEPWVTAQGTARLIGLK